MVKIGYTPSHYILLVINEKRRLLVPPVRSRPVPCPRVSFWKKKKKKKRRDRGVVALGPTRRGGEVVFGPRGRPVL